MIITKRKIETGHGLFMISAVCTNEKEVIWQDATPIEADNDFTICFVSKGSKAVAHGKKHFKDIELAEAYIHMLAVNGFSRADL